MKLLRIVALVIALLLVTLLSGCNATYIYSFKNEGVLDGWIMEDYFAMLSSVTPSVSGEFTWTPDGLFLNGKAVTCPLMFSGDLTYEVVFHLNADASHIVNFGLNMADGTWFGTGQSEIHIEFMEVGGASEYWQIIEHGADAMVMPEYFVTSPLLSLKRDDVNRFKFVKTGDMVQTYMNGTSFATFIIDSYDSIWFAPAIFSRKPPVPPPGPSVVDTGFGFTLESVKITYPEDQLTDTPPVI